MGKTVRDWEYYLCEPLPKASGIYIIWFEGFNSAYIGCSKNIAKRVQAHLYDMRTWPHLKMGPAYKEYGAESVRAAALELVDNHDDIPTAETYWIEQYRNGGWYLYNTELRGKAHRDRMGAR